MMDDLEGGISTSFVPGSSTEIIIAHHNSPSNAFGHPEDQTTSQVRKTPKAKLLSLGVSRHSSNLISRTSTLIKKYPNNI